MPDMTDTEFDAALIAAAFRLAEEQGWLRVSVQAAALAGGLSLAVARGRFRTRLSILQRFGQLLDQAALTGMATEGPVRDRLFDLLMRRFDALQVNRGGVLALFRCHAAGVRGPIQHAVDAAGGRGRDHRYPGHDSRARPAGCLALGRARLAAG